MAFACIGPHATQLPKFYAKEQNVTKHKTAFFFREVLNWCHSSDTALTRAWLHAPVT